MRAPIAWTDTTCTPHKVHYERKRDMWVYTLLDAEGTPIYVGCSRNVADRVRRHRAKAWGHEIADVRTLKFAYRSLALDAEEAAIVATRPKYNIVFNPDVWKAHGDRVVRRPAGLDAYLASFSARAS